MRTYEPKRLPLELMQQAFVIDGTCKSCLRWKIRPREHFKSEAGWIAFNRNTAGTPVGFSVKAGYGRIFFMGEPFALHRVVYAIANGTDPAPMAIDHRDCDPLNNNPGNLRLATAAQNRANGPKRSASNRKTGVSWSRGAGKWKSVITFSRKTYFLGFFACADQAANAYRAAAKQLHGEFFWEGAP